MTWITEHSFWMAAIVSVFISVYAGIFHYQKVLPHNWQGFFIWIPAIWVLTFSLPSLNWLGEKL